MTIRVIKENGTVTGCLYQATYRGITKEFPQRCFTCLSPDEIPDECPRKRIPGNLGCGYLYGLA